MEAIGDEVQISAKNGTTNTISDGTSHTDTYVDSDGNTNPVNGAIFSRDDLKLKGKGTPTLTATPRTASSAERPKDAERQHYRQRRR